MKRALAVFCVAALASCAKSDSKVVVAFAGTTQVLGSGSAEGAALTLYGAKDLVLGATPSVLAQANVADGGWSAPATDVTQVADAVVAVSSGTDALFPTLSGVVDYSSAARRRSTCPPRRPSWCPAPRPPQSPRPWGRASCSTQASSWGW